MQIIEEKYSKLILEEKALLESLSSEIKALSYQDFENKLNAVKENLENLFSIVFIGEFSTGKSSIINALLGEKILPEGITPTTDKITILRYGQAKEEQLENGNYFISIPESRLKGFFIVDTPGTNVTIEQHEQITQEFIPKADIVFFVIGAERAVTGSEAKLIRFIKEDWVKNIVFLLNKIDIVESDDELKNLIHYSETEIERIFKIKPFLIPISAKLALQAKKGHYPELYSRSGMARLEEYIFKTLGEEERIKLKIKGSSELALNLCRETEKALSNHLDKISLDTERLKEFEAGLEGMKGEVLENSRQFTERIRSRLLEFKTRGIEFIDDLIRFENVFKLVRKEKIAKEFEYKVSHQTVKELEKDLEAMVAWAERSSRTLMDSAIDFYRKSIQPESLKDGTGFSFNRMQLIDTVRSELEMRRKQIDPAMLGGNIVDSARGAVASVLGVQVGSLALGAAVISAFSSLIVDVTGILTTIAIMATAFAILPKKRRDAMKEFSTKVDTLIEELTTSVSSQFERDLEGVKMQILDSLVPLKNFYKTQQKKLTESKKKVEEIESKFVEIKNKVS
ncbi:MAG TPA: dynamin family protein [Thermodesulfobacteriota bacterium]|nr:dynamin family protein [Thermodesulfobacteriota bacterium]